MGPLVAVIGSANSGRSYEPSVREHACAVVAAEELGHELATQGCSIAVYSARAAFIEASVVHGYVASGEARSGSIHVYSRYGEDGDFPEMEEFGQVFSVHPEAAADWEVGYYGSLLIVDGVLIIGGGRGAFAAGMLALSRRIALAPVATFGGAAEKIWRCFSKERCFANEDDVALLATRWRPGSAADIVASLVEQHRRQLDEREALARSRRHASRRTAVSLLIGLALMVLALAVIPLSYVTQPKTAGSIAMLVVTPVLAAACGAIVRNTFDDECNWLRTTVLGAVAGTMTFLLFVAAQLVATPDILDGEGARRLIFFVLPVAFIGGLTFDAVFAKMRSVDAARTTPLDR